MAAKPCRAFLNLRGRRGLLVKKHCDASKHRVANGASTFRTNRIRGQKMLDYGFRNFANYRLRVLVECCGKPTKHENRAFHTVCA